MNFRANFLSGVVLTAFLIVSQLIMLPIFLEELGPQLYGVWVLLSVVMIVGQVGDFGFGDAVVRHVALVADKSPEEVTAYAVSGAVFAAGLGLLAAMLIYLGRFPIIAALSIPVELRDIAASVLIVLACIMPLFLMGNIARGVVAGLQRLYLANGVGVLAVLSQVGVSLALVYSGYSIWSLVFGVLSFHLVTLVGCSLVSRLTARINIWELSKFSIERSRALLGFGSKLVVARSLSLAMDPLIAIIIARFLGAEQVAFFEVARRSIFYLRRLIAAGLNAVLPRASYLENRGAAGVEAVRTLNARIAKRILYCGAPVIVVLMFGADLLFPLWLGHAYDARITEAFQVMLFPYFLNVLVIPHYMTLIAWGEAGRAIAVTIVQLVCLLIMVGFNWLLDFPLELNGLVAAYGVGLVGASLTALIFYRVVVNRRVCASSARDLSVPG